MSALMVGSVNAPVWWTRDCGKKAQQVPQGHHVHKPITVSDIELIDQHGGTVESRQDFDVRRGVMSAAEAIIDWKVERLTNLLLLFVTWSELSGSVINPVSCLIYKKKNIYVFII